MPLLEKFGSWCSIPEIPFSIENGHFLLVHTMHLRWVPSCEQISLASSADSYFPQCRKTDVEILKEVLGVNSSSYFLRDSLLEDSAWLGRFSSVSFWESLTGVWARNL